MSFFGKKLIFKYKVEKRNDKVITYPVANLVLLGDNGERFETAAIIDSGSDLFFISEEIAQLLGLELGKEEDAEGIGNEIKVRPSKAHIILIRGKNQIDLGKIPIAVGVGLKSKESSMDILMGRNPLFNAFKITFEQSQGRVIFEKTSPNQGLLKQIKGI